MYAPVVFLNSSLAQVSKTREQENWEKAEGERTGIYVRNNVTAIKQCLCVVIYVRQVQIKENKSVLRPTHNNNNNSSAASKRVQNESSNGANNTNNSSNIPEDFYYCLKLSGAVLPTQLLQLLRVIQQAQKSNFSVTFHNIPLLHNFNFSHHNLITPPIVATATDTTTASTTNNDSSSNNNNNNSPTVNSLTNREVIKRIVCDEDGRMQISFAHNSSL